MSLSPPKKRQHDDNSISLTNISLSPYLDASPKSKATQSYSPNHRRQAESPNRIAKNSNYNEFNIRLQKGKTVTFKQNGFVTIIPVANWKKYNYAQCMNENPEEGGKILCKCILT